MDMSKAFDFVDRTVLLKKMERYGIRGNALKLLKSYLSDRKQVTKINKVCVTSKTERTYVSSQRANNYGVPQGSIVGSFLFIVYINDMPRVTHHPMVLFADDSTVVFSGDNDAKTLEGNINHCLQVLIEWMAANNLKINIDKTKIMTFEQRTNHKKPDVKYGDKIISETTATKFLGLELDRDMSWKTHTDSVCNRLSQHSYALRNLAKEVNQKALITAYHAYVTSTLRYGIIYWGNSTNMATVFRAQKRCVRAICGIKSTESCKPLFENLNILTVPCLYISEVAVFVKTNLHLFEKLHSSRHRYKISGRQHKKAVFHKNLLGMAPHIYNKLPIALLSINDIHLFKKQLNKLLLSKTYYTINEYLTDKNLVV